MKKLYCGFLLYKKIALVLMCLIACVCFDFEMSRSARKNAHYSDVNIKNSEETTSSSSNAHFDKYLKYASWKKKFGNRKVYKYIYKKIYDKKILVQIEGKYDFENDLLKFQSKYTKMKKTYISISKKITKGLKKKYTKKQKKKYKNVSIPPQLVAALHFRENENDYLKGLFDIDLEDGTSYGNISNNKTKNKELKKKRINQFVKSAVKVFYNKIYFAYRCGLKYGKRDLIGMTTFAIYQNGAYDYRWQFGNLHWWHHTGYAFSGTSLYVIGKFYDNKKYDKNMIDKQLGVLMTLDVIIEK